MRVFFLTTPYGTRHSVVLRSHPPSSSPPPEIKIGLEVPFSKSSTVQQGGAGGGGAGGYSMNWSSWLTSCILVYKLWSHVVYNVLIVLKWECIPKYFTSVFWRFVVQFNDDEHELKKGWIVVSFHDLRIQWRHIKGSDKFRTWISQSTSHILRNTKDRFVKRYI